jgi:RNA polymerase sigma factor (sigma-70 family)
MPPNEHENHLLLFQQLAAHSQEALQQIILLYEPMLLQKVDLILKNEALSKEVVADTMHALWINRQEIAKHPNPVAWMIVTARNSAMNMIRNEKRKAAASLDLFPALESTDNVEAAIEAKDLQRLIELAAEKLSPREKLVYTLRIKDGLDRKQIAEQLHVAENTVKNQLYNAMINIRKHLSKLLHSIFV